MPRRKDPRIPDAVLDQLLAGADPKTVFDPNGLLDDLKKALAERVLNANRAENIATARALLDMVPPADPQKQRTSRQTPYVCCLARARAAVPA